MRENIFFRLLEYPAVYRVAQTILAPGGEISLRKKIKHILQHLPTGHDVLDVGCGPSSMLWKQGLQPIGLDISYPYSRAFHAGQGDAVTGSALELPFVDHSFDQVWSIGVLHHLDEKMARRAVEEMFRVCRGGGALVILDAVLPQRFWLRPLAEIIRRLDRGAYMRRQDQLEGVLPEAGSWSKNRYSYAATGLEMLECICLKGQNH